MDDIDSAHRFGGPWTEIKLRAISDYLGFYTQALKGKPAPDRPFETWYVDAFAGTGHREVLGTELPGVIERVRLEGSARRAIRINPPFRHLVFVERDPKRYAALERVKAEFPERDIRTLPGDANDELLRLFASPKWTSGSASRLQRAVVFLDPYGLGVRWSTLRMLAETGRADVWYLFNTHGVLRQLAHDHGALDETKRRALTEMFGTEDWEAEFYRSVEQPVDLFGYAAAQSPKREATAQAVEAFAKTRFETIFTFVSQPIPITTQRKLHAFSLFCLSGNPSPLAISLIQKGVAAQIKKYGPARD
jgi:three-Cys-motif partner protein